jgi:DNA-3-methyladenine glycosylase
MTKFIPFSRSFYMPTADVVAAALLGHWLVRNGPEGPCGGAIVETEAYLTGDPACHAFIGQTKRNQVMWGPPGHSYVYFIYGNHWCFNVVCQPPGLAEAVLIRGLEPLFGLESMRARRSSISPHELSNGPAKLCVAMDIDKRMNGVDLCDAQSPLFIARNPSLKSFLKERGPAITTTRIGLTQAADLPLRYYLDGSPFISRRAKRPAISANPVVP